MLTPALSKCSPGPIVAEVEFPAKIHQETLARRSVIGGEEREGQGEGQKGGGRPGQAGESSRE